jgi:prepilin-type N-terminal cleavage/methylation domain-containing protein
MRQKGFTLVELMIVVTIIGVLAVIAGTSYHKYATRARSAEVYTVIAEFRAKEEMYRTEYSRYCNTQTTCAGAGSETAVFPALLATGEPKAKDAVTGRPAAWGEMGLNPGKNQLYCGYTVVAGAANSFANGGARGLSWFNNVTPTVPWWYLVATCDNNGAVAANTTYVTGMDKNTFFVANEGM